MNIPIKELAKKVPNWNCNGVYLGPYEKSLEQFAKLIVQECASIVEGFELTQEVALDEYVDLEASYVLREHFGVDNEQTD